MNVPRRMDHPRRYGTRRTTSQTSAMVRGRSGPLRPRCLLGVPKMAKFDVVTATIGSTVGLGGTFTISYPAGRTAEDYLGAKGHEIHSQAYASIFAKNGDFTLDFGASNITVTLTTNAYFIAGSKVFVNIDRGEKNIALGEVVTLASDAKMSILQAVKITLGAPATASANAVCLSQALLTATLTGAIINGALLSGTKAVIPSPRNVVAAWTGTAVITVTGTDEYGAVMSESSASGTTMTGKKAFKEITKITTSADVTALTVGTGVVLGLPMFLPDTVDVVKEILDGAAATAGTIAVGDNAVATATTGDVRGTYSPNSAPNGARVYELTAVLRDPSHKGRAQFAG